MASEINVSTNKEGANLLVKVSGRVDTTTAPEFEDAIKANIEGIAHVEIDMDGLDYISSAGLRVLLSTQKIMTKQGDLVISNVCAEVMDVFEVTGFIDILTIK